MKLLAVDFWRAVGWNRRLYVQEEVTYKHKICLFLLYRHLKSDASASYLLWAPVIFCGTQQLKNMTSFNPFIFVTRSHLVGPNDLETTRQWVAREIPGFGSSVGP
jgi:hypothetical protein